MNDISKKVKPMSDRVIVKEHTDDKEKKTASGIILPSGAGEDKSTKRGEVVAVGPGKMDGGKIIPMTIKAGDTIVFQWGDKLKIEGEEYYIVRESEILAVIK